MRFRLALLLLLTGCAAGPGGYSMLPPQVVDDSFDTVTLRMRNSLGTDVDARYSIKAFSHQGKIAVCGARETFPTGLFDEGWGEWVSQAAIYVEGHRGVPIASARFFSEVDPDKMGGVANCAETELPATPGVDTYRARIAGHEVHVL